MARFKKIKDWIKRLFIRKQNSKPPEFFCIICGLPKQSKFCENCRKETPNLFKETPMITVKSKVSMSGYAQRGEISLSYFSIAYGILLTIFISCISVIEINSKMKVFFIILSGILLFWLCFFNGRFRNLIVTIFGRAKQFKEKF
jgi:hypothetical protein